MASVRAKPESGKLYIDFQYLGTRCREQTLLDDTIRNRKRLQQIAEKIDAEIKLGTFDYALYFPNSKKAASFTNLERQHLRSQSASTIKKTFPLFEEFAAVWWRENEFRWRNGTKATNRTNLHKHLLPAFSDSTLDEIDRQSVIQFRTELASTQSRKKGTLLHPKTINHITALLSNIMSEAEERYSVPNPCKRIKKLPVPKTDIKPFTTHEVQQIINAARHDYKCYFAMRFFTGLRTGEIHGLRWKHVDFDHKLILVRETYSRGRTEYTKTDGSQREVRMTDLLFDFVKKHFEESIRNSPNNFVFQTTSGGPIDTKNVTERVWYPLLEQLRLERRRPYQTRHTAATLWLAAGESPEWIARQMGHTTTEMLFKVYSRYVPNLTRQDGSAFDRLLAKEFSQPLPIDSSGPDTDKPSDPTQSSSSTE
ncbi:MAG: DUF3596 domain-containing protein [Alphaproteobacteria bacterium]